MPCSMRRASIRSSAALQAKFVLISMSPRRLASFARASYWAARSRHSAARSDASARFFASSLMSVAPCPQPSLARQRSRDEIQDNGSSRRELLRSAPGPSHQPELHAELGPALKLERNLHLHAIGLDFSILELHIQLLDLRNPKIPQGFGGHVDRRFCGFLPRFRTGADQFNNLVNGVRHRVLLAAFVCRVWSISPPTVLVIRLGRTS